MTYALGEVQTDQATKWTRHAAEPNARGGWATAICPAGPRVWVHEMAGAPIAFPGLGCDPATVCPECMKLAEKAKDSEAAQANPKRRLWSKRGWRRR